MNTLYYFNPENDLALACNSRNYFAPRHAVMLRKAGAMLPLWYCGDGDSILADTMPDGRWFDNVCESFGLLATPVTTVGEAVSACSPWGWSPAVCQRFSSAGVSDSCLPSTEWISDLRELSHRRASVHLLTGLKRLGLYEGMIPQELVTVDTLPGLIEQSGSEGVFFKSPWSSSGRGVIPTQGMPLRSVIVQANGMIRRQGSVMIEQSFRKVADFAMLFHKPSADGRVNFDGYSMFETGGQAYTGNILADDAVLFNRLSQFVDGGLILAVRDALPVLLNEYLGDSYSGYMGVDMMIVEDEHGARGLHPCVELNLRMTMGVVAHVFTRRFLGEGLTGRLTVARGCDCATEGYAVDGRRLVGGKLSLVAPGGEFSITVEVDR